MRVEPNEKGGPYIYVSFYSGIRDKAEGVIQALQAYGYRVWFAAGSLRRREIG